MRKIRAKEVLDKYYQIDIDFIDRPDSADLVGKFVYDEIERQLRETYQITLTDDNIVRGALHNDLDRFSRSVKGRAYKDDPQQYKRAELEFIEEIQRDRHVFLQKVLHHFRAGRNSSVAIFFDNLDRRIEPIQEEAFLRVCNCPRLRRPGIRLSATRHFSPLEKGRCARLGGAQDNQRGVTEDPLHGGETRQVRKADCPG